MPGGGRGRTFGEDGEPPAGHWRSGDPWEVLGLGRGAGAEEIRKRYRWLARRYHPDKKGGDVDAFKAVGKARDRLL